jgi:hypothetical protein
MRVKKITFNKEYALEIAFAGLRKKHNIPEDYAVKVREYGEDFVSFVEVKEVESEEIKPEEIKPQEEIL